MGPSDKQAKGVMSELSCRRPADVQLLHCIRVADSVAQQCLTRHGSMWAGSSVHLLASSNQRVAADGHVGSPSVVPLSVVVVWALVTVPSRVPVWLTCVCHVLDRRTGLFGLTPGGMRGSALACSSRDPDTAQRCTV